LLCSDGRFVATARAYLLTGVIVKERKARFRLENYSNRVNFFVLGQQGVELQRSHCVISARSYTWPVQTRAGSFITSSINGLA
jgi:hypothetical protein